jgi:hypothetical protein
MELLVGTSQMSDIRQMSVAMQRLVVHISLVTKQCNDLLNAFPWQCMNAAMERNCLFVWPASELYKEDTA